jgi:hypothetical protein
MHAAYATWSYFAWYRSAKLTDFHVVHEPWFAAHEYSGGADKLGHFWSNYAMTRGTTAVLVAGGWRRLPSSLVAAGLTEVAFTLTEFEDGFVFGFDTSDLIANFAGSAFAVAIENVPKLDEFLDFRVQYVPSEAFRWNMRMNGSVDVGQDYSGQSYVLAFHLGAIPGLRDHEWGMWSRFLDVAVGFEAHHYWPLADTTTNPPRQTLYGGLSINMQGVLRQLFRDSAGRQIGIGAFEVFNVPYTTLRYAEVSRRIDAPPASPD